MKGRQGSADKRERAEEKKEGWRVKEGGMDGWVDGRKERDLALARERAIIIRLSEWKSH